MKRTNFAERGAAYDDPTASTSALNDRTDALAFRNASPSPASFAKVLVGSPARRAPLEPHAATLSAIGRWQFRPFGRPAHHHLRRLLRAVLGLGANSSCTHDARGVYRLLGTGRRSAARSIITARPADYETTSCSPRASRTFKSEPAIRMRKDSPAVVAGRGASRSAAVVARPAVRHPGAQPAARVRAACHLLRARSPLCGPLSRMSDTRRPHLGGLRDLRRAAGRNSSPASAADAAHRRAFAPQG